MQTKTTVNFHQWVEYFYAALSAPSPAALEKVAETIGSAYTSEENHETFVEAITSFTNRENLRNLLSVIAAQCRKNSLLNVYIQHIAKVYREKQYIFFTETIVEVFTLDELLAEWPKSDASFWQNLTILFLKGDSKLAQIQQLLDASRIAIDKKRDYDGNTPLHLCAQNNTSAVFIVLYLHGANLFNKNTKGLTPLLMLSHPSANTFLDALFQNEGFRKKLLSNPSDYACAIRDIMQLTPSYLNSFQEQRKLRKIPDKKWLEITSADMHHIVTNLKQTCVDELISAGQRATAQQGYSIFAAVEALDNRVATLAYIVRFLSEKRERLTVIFAHETYLKTTLYQFIKEVSKSHFLSFCFNLNESSSAYDYATNCLKVLFTLQDFESNFLFAPVTLPNTPEVNALLKLKSDQSKTSALFAKERIPSSNMDTTALLRHYLPLINQTNRLSNAYIELSKIESVYAKCLENNIVSNMIKEIDSLISKLDNLLSQNSLQQIPVKVYASQNSFLDSDYSQVTFFGIIILIKNQMQEFLHNLTSTDKIHWASPDEQNKKEEEIKPVLTPEITEEVNKEGLLSARQYYQICLELKIEPCSSWLDIKKQIKVLRIKMHPDHADISGTEDLFQTVNKYIERLRAHHDIISQLSSEALEYLLLERTANNKKAEKNNVYNRFLLAHILNHTSPSQQQILFLGRIADDNNATLALSFQEISRLKRYQIRLGLWEHPDLLLHLPQTLLHDSLQLLNEMYQWEHVIFNFELTKKLLLDSGLTVKQKSLVWLKSDQERALVKNWNALAELYQDISSYGKITLMGIKNFIDILRIDFLETLWPVASLNDVDIAKIPFYRTLMQIFLLEFNQNSDVTTDGLLLPLFSFCYLFHRDLVSQENKELLKARFKNLYQKKPCDINYIHWLIFDASAIAVLPQKLDDSSHHWLIFDANAIAVLPKKLDDNSQVRVAEILITYHDEYQLATEILVAQYEKLKATKLDLSNALIPHNSDVNRYFHVIASLKKLGYRELTPDEQRLAVIPDWRIIRNDMLKIINEFMVINQECHDLLIDTRRALIEIDRKEDLSDKAKIKLTLEAFDALIRTIDTKANSSVLTKIGLVVKLKPLVQRFFAFIEEHFFLVSQANALFKNVRYVDKAPQSELEKVKVLPNQQYLALAKLRLVALDYIHTPTFFNPGWNVEVYESLDRLRQLAYDNQNALFSALRNTKQHAVLIYELIESIQFESPEKIMDILTTAKKSAEYASIPGFIFALDNARRDINRIAGLIAYYDDSVLLLTANAEPQPAQPQVSVATATDEAVITYSSPTLSRGYDNVD